MPDEGHPVPNTQRVSQLLQGFTLRTIADHRESHVVRQSRNGPQRNVRGLERVEAPDKEDAARIAAVAAGLGKL